MVNISQLQFSYQQTPLLSIPHWEIPTGTSSLLLGESGSGKTTLLHLLAGLLGPTSGSIKIKDIDLGRLSPKKLDHFRGKHIGLIFQKPHLLQALSVQDNLLVAQYFAGEKQTQARAQEVLEVLGLMNKLSQKPYQLSQGEAQRVSIARAWMNKPDLILADEPTSSLDDHNCQRVAQLLQNLSDRNGTTLLIVTHDQRLKDYFSQQWELDKLNQLPS